ncbi:MAG: PD-(D/E)XK nuclease family protein [Flavobacteriales bacterium]|nr:PD-(D/E)XK nuclease family protein [Flavobacteriales bacterium]
MSSFLADLADQLLEDHRDHLREVTVVLPGKRAGIFLKRELKRKGYHGWLPKITTLSELMTDMSKLKRGDSLDLTFELYICHKNTTNNSDTFEYFLQWGSTLLTDFNEIDHYLINPKHLFKNIRDFKEIDEWSFGEEEWTTTQKRFAGFWDQLLPLYTSFQEHMRKIGLFYGGAIARKVAEDPIGFFQSTGASHLVVAGLNALTKAEQKLLTKLQEREMCTVIWDADSYFVDRKNLEAGHFIRQMRHLGNAKKLPSHFLASPKKVVVVGSSSTVNQMQYIHQELKGIEGDQTEIGLVLPDNGVLPSLLPSVPAKYESINVTMGESMSHTQYKSLCDGFFRLFDVNGKRLRYVSLMAFLRHPLLNQQGKNTLANIQEYIIKNNIVFVGEEDINTAKGNSLGRRYDAFFRQLYVAARSRKVVDVIEALSNLLECIRPIINEEEKEAGRKGWQDRKLQSWNLMQSLVVRMGRLITQYPMLESVRELERITMKLLGKMQIDLKGEPLEGLQIMGLLESRSLDFKKVFILSGNEGVLPKQSFAESMIPSEIRYGNGMPTRFDRDAIFAYYFYRLIQRADEVHLLYTAGESSHNTGEKSRYIQQLESCKLLLDAGSAPTSFSIRSKTPSGMPKIPVIAHSDWADNRLKELLEAGLSPSAMNKWIACPADFYYRYILGLREQADVEEEMESSTFGSMIHKVLEDGLKQVEGQVLSKEALLQLKAQIVPLMEEALDEVRYRHMTTSGVNYLSKKVAIRYLEKLIDKELEVVETSEVELIKLEEKLSGNVRIPSYAEPIRIKGSADRIDRINGQLRIVDYKSGKVSQDDLTLKEDWHDQLGQSDKHKALQTLIYAFLARMMYQEDAVAGIISTRNFSPGFMPVVKKAKPQNEVIKMDLQFAAEFTTWLQERLQEMVSGSKPLAHDESSRFCEYCVHLD